MLDFKMLKSSVPIEHILELHRIRLRSHGDHTLIGPCPIHGGDNPTAFRVHCMRGIWHCFTRCGGGTQLDLVARLEGLTLYQAAVRLQEIADSSPTRQAPEYHPIVPAEPNPPLDFQLRLTDHPYLTEIRRLRPATAEFFGVGFCSRGLLAGRIAIPIHDHQGRLVAYVGRALNPTAPKYRFPSALRKSALVYNAHRIPRGAPCINVVEGFFDVFHLHENGYPATVALMGSTGSDSQLGRLTASGKPLNLLLDGDAAGQRGCQALAAHLQRLHHPFQAITLPPTIQPEHLSSDDLAALLGPPISSL
jgi:DNA primase